MRTAPTPSSLAMRSSTIAVRPTSAAAPVRICGGVYMWRRATGRTSAKQASVRAAKTTNWTVPPPPSRSASIAPKAPTANGARKKPVVMISPTAANTPAISQMSQASIAGRVSQARAVCVEGADRRPRPAPYLRAHERAGEVVRVKRAEVLERLADADELDRDAQLAGDGQRDAALGRAVELGQHDAVDWDRLGEQLGLAHAVLAGGRVDRQQRLVRRVGHLLADDAADLRQLVHEL